MVKILLKYLHGDILNDFLKIKYWDGGVLNRPGSTITNLWNLWSKVWNLDKAMEPISK
jgi:hypothetical protein